MRVDFQPLLCSRRCLDDLLPLPFCSGSPLRRLAGFPLRWPVLVRGFGVGPVVFGLGAARVVFVAGWRCPVRPRRRCPRWCLRAGPVGWPGLLVGLRPGGRAVPCAVRWPFGFRGWRRARFRCRPACCWLAAAPRRFPCLIPPFVLSALCPRRAGRFRSPVACRWFPSCASVGAGWLRLGSRWARVLLSAWSLAGSCWSRRNDHAVVAPPAACVLLPLLVR